MKVGCQRYEPHFLWQGLLNLLSYHLAVDNLEFGIKYDINLKESHKMWITLKIFLRGKTPLLKLSTGNSIRMLLSSIHSSVFFKDRKYWGNFRCKVYMEKCNYSELVTDSRSTPWCEFRGRDLYLTLYQSELLLCEKETISLCIAHLPICDFFVITHEGFQGGEYFYMYLSSKCYNINVPEELMKRCLIQYRCCELVSK